MDVSAIADTLFQAIEAGDIAAVQRLWSPDIAVWHSGDHQDNNHDRALRVIRWFVGRTGRRRYEVLDRQPFDGSAPGFVQQHILHATGEHGSIAMRVCIVIKLDGAGLITRIDEYFDPAEMAPLMDRPATEDS
ncbi:nuclear transport factor 2 family protein [Mycolicibacterium mengxianglii]|uniref:nuclear transport factor 2 family protein n=1 Tax=Mycolicibacterium mengxianglii TaxID=2736649 RepID=UPI0018D02ED3|nr:nuclear transport factor 2 family protein [Mycolicibacterium mengxianglii]